MAWQNLCLDLCGHRFDPGQTPGHDNDKETDETGPVLRPGCDRRSIGLDADPHRLPPGAPFKRQEATMFYGLLIRTFRGRDLSSGGNAKAGKRRVGQREKGPRANAPLLLHWARGPKGLGGHWDPGGSSSAH